MNISSKKNIRFFLLPLLVMLACNANAINKTQEGTRGYIDERYKPVEPYTGETRSGEVVYNYSCATCHNRTTQGAPLPDDDVQWSKRLQEKGKEVLVQHVIEGFNQDLMPPKGGCRNCSEKEIRAAVDYILLTSGAIAKVD